VCINNEILYKLAIYAITRKKKVISVDNLNPTIRDRYGAVIHTKLPLGAAGNLEVLII
jgi:hypothetical protein